MKKDSIVVSFLILICGLSLILVSGCATNQPVKASVVKSDTAVESKIPENASMNDILAGETAKSKAGWVAFQKKEAARKAAAAKAAQEKTTK